MHGLRGNRVFWPGACALAMSLGGMATAQAIDVTINTEIVSMTLTGTGPMPFGTGADPSMNDGYQNVETMVTASESPLLESSGTMQMSVTFGLDPVTFEPLLTVDATGTFDFFLDLSFVDVDPTFDFAAGLAPSFSLPAVAGKPLTVMLTDSLSFSLTDPNAPPTSAGTQVTSESVTRDLGVDVNASGENDFIQYAAENFDFGEDLSFEDAVLTNIDTDSIIEDILAGTFDPNMGFVIDAQVGIQTASFTFSGLVADSLTDPEFSIPLSSPPGTGVPEPGTLLLLLTSLIGAGAATRRRSRPS